METLAEDTVSVYYSSLNVKLRCKSIAFEVPGVQNRAAGASGSPKVSKRPKLQAILTHSPKLQEGSGAAGSHPPVTRRLPGGSGGGSGAVWGRFFDVFFNGTV